MGNEQILNVDLQTRRFVQAPESSGPVTLEFYQGDTHTLALRGWVQSAEAPIGQIYVPAPITYSTMAAGLFAGKPDAAPEDGTFKLRFAGETTGELKWNIGKGELATALNALTTVTAAGGLTVLEKGPAHFYTVQWNSGDPGASITAVDVELSPVCLVRIRKNTVVPGQVLIKLVRAPLAFTEDFEYPTPPAVVLAPVRTGSALRDEIQSLTIPEGATGEFALIWNATETQVVSVAEATAAEIARVLNELYTDGVTRFVVTNPATRTFYTYFMGPLGKADQPMLDKAMYSQTAVQAPVFTLPITAEVPVDLELLARQNIPIVFEIAAWNGTEKTVIAQQVVTLINNAIDDELGMDLADSGAVQVVRETVYIDNTTATPIVTVSPGAEYSPGEPGEEVIINHSLNTFNADVRVYLKTSDDPEQWTKIPDDQYEAVATSANHVQITGIPMEADPNHEYYFGRWKIYVASPDATVQILAHEHPVTEVYRMVGGVPKTLDVILDELEASLPTDWPAIPASKIVGPILAEQIAIETIGTALQASATFLTTLNSLLAETSVITTIANGLGTSTAFEETLKTVFTNSNTVKETMLKQLVEHADFRAAVLSALQLGATVNTSVIPFVIPDLEVKLPAVPGPLPCGFLNPTNGGAKAGHLPRADQSNAGHYYTVDGKAFSRLHTKVFQDGEKVYSTGHDWFAGEITDTTVCSLALLEFSGMVYAGSNASVTIYGRFFKDTGTDAFSFLLYKDLARTQLIGSVTADDAYLNAIDFNFTGITGMGTLTAISGHVEGFVGLPDDQSVDFVLTRTTENFITATEYDHELFTLSVMEQMLAAATRLSVAFAVTLQLRGNCEGYYLLELIRGHRTSAGGADFDGIAWDETVISQPMVITDAAVTHAFIYTVERDAEGVMEAEKTVYTKTSAATAPVSANFILRGRLSRFDTEDVANPEGQLAVSMKGAAASIVKIS